MNPSLNTVKDKVGREFEMSRKYWDFEAVQVENINGLHTFQSKMYFVFEYYPNAE